MVRKKKLTVAEQKGIDMKRKEEAAKYLVSKPENIAANVLTELYANTIIDSDTNLKGIDCYSAGKHMREAAVAVKTGDLSTIEDTLSSQVTLLHSWFCRYLTLGFRNHGTADFDRVLSLYHLALRMQEQCRKTAATLGSIKAPRQTTFVKQQNTANQQIVNNKFPEINSQENTNKILAGDKPNGERMDTRTEPSAIETNKTMETMAKYYGPENARKEAAFVPKCEKTRDEVSGA